MAHWPSGAGPSAHFAPAVQRAMPPGSPLIQTLGGTPLASVRRHQEHKTRGALSSASLRKESTA
jgi:hypothetical protein